MLWTDATSTCQAFYLLPTLLTDSLPTNTTYRHASLVLSSQTNLACRLVGLGCVYRRYSCHPFDLCRQCVVLYLPRACCQPYYRRIGLIDLTFDFGKVVSEQTLIFFLPHTCLLAPPHSTISTSSNYSLLSTVYTQSKTLAISWCLRPLNTTENFPTARVSATRRIGCEYIQSSLMRLAAGQTSCRRSE